jgi:hypothetical protein
VSTPSTTDRMVKAAKWAEACDIRDAVERGYFGPGKAP